MTTYRLDLSYPPPPARGELVTVATVSTDAGDVALLVQHLAPWPDDHGLRWQVWRRANGDEGGPAGLPLPYPSFEAARDAAHEAAFRMVKEWATSKEG